MRGLVAIAVFSVLSAAGGLLKLGTPVGSIALDSWPGFFVAGYFGVWTGAVVGVLGHLASGATAGFPLGSLHALVAVMQGGWVAAFGLVVRRLNRSWGVAVAAVLAVGLNGVLAPLVIAVVRPSLRELMFTLIPVLVLASAVNVGGAAVAILSVARARLPRA